MVPDKITLGEHFVAYRDAGFARDLVYAIAVPKGIWGCPHNLVYVTPKGVIRGFRWCCFDRPMGRKLEKLVGTSAFNNNAVRCEAFWR